MLDWVLNTSLVNAKDNKKRKIKATFFFKGTFPP